MIVIKEGDKMTNIQHKTKAEIYYDLILHGREIHEADKIYRGMVQSGIIIERDSNKRKLHNIIDDSDKYGVKNNNDSSGSGTPTVGISGGGDATMAQGIRTALTNDAEGVKVLDAIDNAIREAAERKNQLPPITLGNCEAELQRVLHNNTQGLSNKLMQQKGGQK